MAEYLGSGIVSVKAEVDEALKFFENLKVSEKTISKSILSSVGQGGRKAVRQGYNGILRRRSGALYKSIKYKVYKNGKNLIFSNSATSGKKTSKDGRIARYGYMLASGYTITPKNANGYLTFNVNGKWVKKKSVTVPAKDFTEGPLDRYFASGDYEDRIEKALQKQVTKIEKKLGVAND